MIEQKDFIKNKVFFWALILTALFIFFSFVSAETIVVVPGDSNNNNPPADNTPTVDYIECPEGYSCIKAEDYTQFISSLENFTAEIDERTGYFSAMFDRFDKKIENDKELYDSLLLVTERAQNQADRFEAMFKTSEEEKSSIERVYGKKINDLEVQVAELRAVGIWQFFLVIVSGVFLVELVFRIKRQGKFIWRWIEEKIPIKLG